jgi:hypothetical protein
MNALPSASDFLATGNFLEMEPLARNPVGHGRQGKISLTRRTVIEPSSSQHSLTNKSVGEGTVP